MDPLRHRGISPIHTTTMDQLCRCVFNIPSAATHLINQSHISDDSGSPHSPQCLLVRTLLAGSDSTDKGGKMVIKSRWLGECKRNTSIRKINKGTQLNKGSGLPQCPQTNRIAFILWSEPGTALYIQLFENILQLPHFYQTSTFLCSSNKLRFFIGCSP